MIKEGILVQTSSEKHLTPSDHSSFMASLRNSSLRGSEEERGTVGLREGSIERFCNGSVQTEDGSSPNWASWRFEVFWMFPEGSSSNRKENSEG